MAERRRRRRADRGTLGRDRPTARRRVAAQPSRRWSSRTRAAAISSTTSSARTSGDGSATRPAPTARTISTSSLATAHGDEEAWTEARAALADRAPLGRGGARDPAGAGVQQRHRRTPSSETWLDRLPGGRAPPGGASGRRRRASSCGPAGRTPRRRSSSARSRDTGSTAARATAWCGASGTLYAQQGRPAGEPSGAPAERRSARHAARPRLGSTRAGAVAGWAIRLALVLALGGGRLVALAPAGRSRAARGPLPGGPRGAARCLWAWGSFPDYVVALGMGIAWVLLRVAPTATAFGGFATSTWFLMLGHPRPGGGPRPLGPALPDHARSRCVAFRRRSSGGPSALLTAGIVSTVLIPSAQARVTFMGPVVLGLADTLKYPPRSRGQRRARAGRASRASAWRRRSSSPGRRRACSRGAVLPEATRDQVSWLAWLQAVLVLEAVSLGAALAWIAWRYRPAEPPPCARPCSTPSSRCSARRRRDEWITALVALAVARRLDHAAVARHRSGLAHARRALPPARYAGARPRGAPGSGRLVIPAVHGHGLQPGRPRRPRRRGRLVRDARPRRARRRRRPGGGRHRRPC